MKTFKPSIVALGAVCALAFAGNVWAAPTWITIGDEARALLTEVAPQAKTLASRQIDVTVPERRGSGRLVRGKEGVHAVEVDDGVLEALSQSVHERLHRCGGFVKHESAAEALTVLHRLQTPVDPTLVPSYVIDNQTEVTPLVPQLQASNILATIQSMSDFQNRKYNSSHGVAASTWLFNNWSQFAAGRRDIRVTQIAHTGFVQKSVMLEMVGSSNSAEVIVLGAHLDSTGSGAAETVRAPGADDDASGVASLTEVIRVLAGSLYAPKRTIRFFAYAAEEAGLLGSKQIVAAVAEQGTKVVGVMQLDMTAYQGDPIDLWIYTDYTNAAQNQFVADLAAAYLPALTVGYDRCGYGCSDHASWYAQGYPASLPFEASDAHYNFALHTPNDTIATFGGQANHALKFSQLALAFAVELGSDGPPAVLAGR